MLLKHLSQWEQRDHCWAVLLGRKSLERDLLLFLKFWVISVKFWKQFNNQLQDSSGVECLQPIKNYR